METFSRPGKDEYFLLIADMAALRSTCIRRRAGCVLVDSKNHIVATGYNGGPSGFPHCLDKPCEGAFSESGTDLDRCLAIHCEINAFLQLRSDDDLIMYITVTPCMSICARVVCNSNVKRIVAREWYPQEGVEALFQQAGISVEIKDGS